MIQFLDLPNINARFENEFKADFNAFLKSGWYILGDAVKSFENNYASFCGTKYCVGVSNGFDALVLIFKGYIELGKLKKGDEVIVPANTYIATILAVIEAGLTPVFVEPNPDTFNIEAPEIESHISSKTKAILVVHLYGQLTKMKVITTLARQHNLLVIEDAAQAHGAKDESSNLKAGNLSDAAGFSFYPSKNLGALGDAGAITTNDKALVDVIKKIRNYGTSSKYVNDLLGTNNRLDELQAVFLNIKLKQLDADNEVRRSIAKHYLEKIKNSKIKLPFYDNSQNHIFHLFVVLVEDRDAFIQYLSANGVQASIHYPVAPHRQKALHRFNHLKFPITEIIHETCVSIPMSPILRALEVKKVIKTLNDY